MERAFDHEVREVKRQLVTMAGLVERNVKDALTALRERDRTLATQVIGGDRSVDQAENEIEERCINLIARHQPVAVDLRFLIGAIKINTDLERISDHAVNIAGEVREIAGFPPVAPSEDLVKMENITLEMLRDAIDAFVRGDAKKAEAVCDRDDQVDVLKDRLLRDLVDDMRKDSDQVVRALDLLLITRNLERIADLATNISEETIYISEARVIRHQGEQRTQ